MPRETTVLYSLWGRGTSPAHERFGRELGAALERAGFAPAADPTEADLVINLIDPRDPKPFRRKARGTFVADFVTPLIAAVGGKPDFADLTFTINDSVFRYGHFFNAILAFLIIAAVIFFFVVRPLNALMARMKPEPAVDRVTRECPECLSDIPEEAHRCAFCTAEVRAA
jgi:large conductance mechanosensitive channel